MSTYVIGDIHGHADLMDQLLEQLNQRDSTAQLWFVGDLVNRGPDSLGVMRRVRALGERAITVLGNHDLAFLSLAMSAHKSAYLPEDLQQILAAPDCQHLLNWLLQRPLIHTDTSLGWTMVHAGLPPTWGIEKAHKHAQELENCLRSDEASDFLSHLFDTAPTAWQDGLTGQARLRYIANALTCQRFIDQQGHLHLGYKKTWAQAPAGLQPWFSHPERASRQQKIVFGHWSALETVKWPEYNVWGIDTGAAWGGPLSALDISQPQPELIQAHP